MNFRLEISVEDGEDKDFYGIWEYECDNPSREKKLEWLTDVVEDLMNRIHKEEMEYEYEKDERRRNDF